MSTLSKQLELIVAMYSTGGILLHITALDGSNLQQGGSFRHQGEVAGILKEFGYGAASQLVKTQPWPIAGSVEMKVAVVETEELMKRLRFTES